MSSDKQRVFVSGPLVKRLRHRPFTAVTGVRVPYGSPLVSPGGMAQLVEHLLHTQGVAGSSPAVSTKTNPCSRNDYRDFYYLFVHPFIGFLDPRKTPFWTPSRGQVGGQAFGGLLRVTRIMIVAAPHSIIHATILDMMAGAIVAMLAVA